jgi:uncharacterized membrane protein (UPF0127 family)
MVGRRARFLVLAVAVLGCAAPATEPRSAPTGGASAATEVVTLDGRAWTVLVADRDGMRGRADFAGADGMLFDRGREVDPASVYFVMDGVAFPLAIAWFDGAGRWVGTTTMATCPAEPCPRYAAPGPFRWAIEAPVGAFDDLGPDARLVVPPG